MTYTYFCVVSTYILHTLNFKSAWLVKFWRMYFLTVSYLLLIITHYLVHKTISRKIVSIKPIKHPKLLNVETEYFIFILISDNNRSVCQKCANLCSGRGLWINWIALCLDISFWIFNRHSLSVETVYLYCSTHSPHVSPPTYSSLLMTPCSHCWSAPCHHSSLEPHWVTRANNTWEYVLQYSSEIDRTHDPRPDAWSTYL